MYESIVDQMKCYERLKLIDWTNKARLLAICQMDSNILVCIRTKMNTGRFINLMLVVYDLNY